MIRPATAQSTGNQALQNFLFQPEVAYGKTKTQVFHANVAGSLWTLPAGELGFAAGLERREESGTFNPDPMAVAGVTTNLSSGPTRGAYAVDEAYLELEVPILADMAFAQELTLSLASRYSDYDTFGNTTNNKIGMKWRPIEELLLRASANDGFRAPTIADLFGGGSQTFSFFTDPCDTNFGSSKPGTLARTNCVGGPAGFGAGANTYRQLGQGLQPVNAPNSQTPVAFTQGSNPLLIPEVSKSQTIGAVWSPSFAEGLNLALDWWKIRITETIVQDTPTAILNDCYVQGIASRCSPTLFTRDPVLGHVNFMSFGNRNAGYRKVEGFDFDVSYRFKTDVGDFSVVSNSTYTVSDFNLSTNDPRVPLSDCRLDQHVPHPLEPERRLADGRLRRELDGALLLVDEGRLHLRHLQLHRAEPGVQRDRLCTHRRIRPRYHHAGQCHQPSQAHRLGHLQRRAVPLAGPVGCHGCLRRQQRVREGRPGHVQPAERQRVVLRWLRHRPLLVHEVHPALLIGWLHRDTNPAPRGAGFFVPVAAGPAGCCLTTDGLRARWPLPMQVTHARKRGRAVRIRSRFHADPLHMIELNPVRQRIADLTGRLHSLRGYL